MFRFEPKDWTPELEREADLFEQQWRQDRAAGKGDETADEFIDRHPDDYNALRPLWIALHKMRTRNNPVADLGADIYDIVNGDLVGHVRHNHSGGGGPAVPAGSALRSNDIFDSTLGYPGEGPDPPKSRRGIAKGKKKLKKKGIGRMPISTKAIEAELQRAFKSAGDHGPTVRARQGLWGPSYTVRNGQYPDVITQTRREFMFDVTCFCGTVGGLGTGQWNPATIVQSPFSPTAINILTILPTIGNLYSTYRIRRLCFEFVSNATVQFGGNIIMAWDADPAGNENYDITTVENMKNQLTFSPGPYAQGNSTANPLCFTVGLDSMNPQNKMGLMCSQDGGPLSEWAAGRFLIGTDGINVAGTLSDVAVHLGKLYVHYDIEFRNIRPHNPVGAGVYAHMFTNAAIGNTQPYGAGPAAYRFGSDVLVEIDANNQNRLSVYRPGRYLIVIRRGTLGTDTLADANFGAVRNGFAVTFNDGTTTATRTYAGTGTGTTFSFWMMQSNGSQSTPCVHEPAAAWSTIAGAIATVDTFVCQLPNGFTYNLERKPTLEELSAQLSELRAFISESKVESEGEEEYATEMQMSKGCGSRAWRSALSAAPVAVPPATTPDVPGGSRSASRK